MSSKKSHEGYLLIDNRCNEGIPDSLFTGKYSHLRGNALKGKQEYSTFTCSHCGAIVIPNLTRSRPRNYCRRCDHYVCDNPSCMVECKPIQQLFDQIREDKVRADQSAVDPTARIIIP